MLTSHLGLTCLIFISSISIISGDLVALKADLDQKALLSQKICTELKKFYGSYDPNSGNACPYVDACSSNLETEASLTCTPGFGTDQDCGCSSSNAKISNLKSVIRFVEDADKNSKEMKSFLCSTPQMNTVFQQNSITDSKLVWQYVGSEYGAALYHPARRWTYNLDTSGCQVPGTCAVYDARFRPWYVSASSGNKRIILLIDVSGSMTTERLNKAKSAAKTIIDGLSFNDWVSVIKFSTFAQDCVFAGNGKLVPANENNRILLKQCIDSFVASGSTDFEDAFKLGYSVLDATTAAPNCETAFLFMTDGVQSKGANPMTLIEANKAKYDAKVFSYSFGSEADRIVPTQLACATDGLWKSIKDTDDLRSQMANYYSYFASDKALPSVWSEIYLDFSLNITMTTSASPCFSNEGDLLGVSGVDALISDLLKIHNNLDDIKNELKSRSTGCTRITHSKEKLAALRGGTYNYCNPAPSTIGTDFIIILGSLAGSGVGVVFLIIIILMFIGCGLFCCWNFCALIPRQRTVPSKRVTNYKPPPIELEQRPPPTAPQYYEGN
eukprot:gene9160-1248_t